MANKELVDKALEKYAVRRDDLSKIKKDIKEIVDSKASDTFIREEDSRKNKRSINDIRDIRRNTLRDSKLKGLYDKVKKDGVVTNGEAIKIIEVQKALRQDLAKALAASIEDEQQARFEFNMSLASAVDAYLKNFVKVTKGLRPKSFLRALELRTLVATLELDDVSEVDVTEDISASGHPVQRILNLIK
jgi:hypothetical protein